MLHVGFLDCVLPADNFWSLGLSVFLGHSPWRSSILREQKSRGESVTHPGDSNNVALADMQDFSHIFKAWLSSGMGSPGWLLGWSSFRAPG